MINADELISAATDVLPMIIDDALAEYRGLYTMLDRRVEQKSLRKEGFRYELNPRRPYRPVAHTFEEIGVIERLSRETKDQADKLRELLIIVQRSRDEVKRASQAILTNLTMLDDARQRIESSVEAAAEAAEQFDNCRKREKAFASRRRPGRRGARTAGSKEMTMPKKAKKAKKAAAPPAEEEATGSTTLTDEEKEAKAVELIDKLYGELTPEDKLEKSKVRAALRRIDPNWRETYSEHVAAWFEEEEEEEEAPPPPPPSKKAAKKAAKASKKAKKARK